MGMVQPKFAAGERPPTKLERVLAALIQRPHTTRELELFPVCDHVAHSTIPELRRRAIEISTNLVTIPGYGGQVARVAQYEIPLAGRPHAIEVLAQLRERRFRGRR